jgi:hypothetical protein
MLMPTYIDISKNNHKSLLNSVVSVREANRMAYKDMKLSLYLCITLGLFGLEVIGAIFIDNITTVFNFASAFGVTCLAFWFPAGYYLLAEKRFKKDEASYKITSYVLFAMGFANFFVGIAAAVIGII